MYCMLCDACTTFQRTCEARTGALPLPAQCTYVYSTTHQLHPHARIHDAQIMLPTAYCALTLLIYACMRECAFFQCRHLCMDYTICIYVMQYCMPLYPRPMHTFTYWDTWTYIWHVCALRTFGIRYVRAYIAVLSACTSSAWVKVVKIYSKRISIDILKPIHTLFLCQNPYKLSTVDKPIPKKPASDPNEKKSRRCLVM